MILRVMIVEDEDMIRNGLVKTLPWADMGCTVIGSAGDGGLEQIVERRPDVVITDIRMPEMDGFEMLERALAVYRFHIIIFTSYAEFDYAQKAISIHAYDYLLKPLDEKRLAELLETLRRSGLEPKRLRLVQHDAASAPSLLLLESRRGGRPGLAVEPTLLLRDADGRETDETRRIYFRDKE